MSGAVVAIRGKILRAFANANAFSEAEAKSIEELGLPFEYGMFKRMIKRGNIIKTVDGRFYMNRTYYNTRLQRRKIVLSIAGGILIGVIIWIILFHL